MKVRELLAAARTRLSVQPAGRLEAEILLCQAVGKNRAWLFANPEHPVEPIQEGSYRELVERRSDGEPIAYLTGVREFWSLPIRVTPDVLIPRPETELLVESVLAAIPPDARWRIADLGTGSGAIALVIARERPLCEVHATDISEAALEVARENERELAPGRITFHRGSWLDPLDGRFHLLVSNPPYIAPGDPHLLQGDCRFEPAGALTTGHGGLQAFQQIAGQALKFLEPGGMLVFEHGPDQGGAVREILERLGYHDIATRKDLENRERMTSGLSSA